MIPVKGRGFINHGFTLTRTADRPRQSQLTNWLRFAMPGAQLRVVISAIFVAVCGLNVVLRRVLAIRTRLYMHIL